MLVRERAVAIAVVQIFEESVFHYEHATRLRDPGRARFLEDVLGYYTDRLLLNPRLLWFWAPGGGNMRADFEPATRSYYDAHVQVPKGAPFDNVGPFPG